MRTHVQKEPQKYFCEGELYLSFVIAIIIQFLDLFI